MAKLTLGLALGSGAARGWAHIGVLRALAIRGIYPDVIAGASMGSLVGAATASAQLDVLEEWVRSLRRLDVLRLLDASFRGGFIAGSKVMDAVGEQLEDHGIETMGLAFAAVATDLDSGREVWLRDGSMLAAVRASCGLPGLFAPIRHHDRWLIDGGVVNPVPVSLCKALGADVTIAVNLNAHLMNRRRRPEPRREEPALPGADELSSFDRLSSFVGTWMGSWQRDETQPRMFDVVGASINIMQERITRSRMAGEPPEVELRPVLHDIQLMDFHRSEEIIAAGAAAVAAAAPQLDALLKVIE